MKTLTPLTWITSIIAQVVIGILASTIVFWFSRQREFRADAGSGRLAGRDKMIRSTRPAASIDTAIATAR